MTTINETLTKTLFIMKKIILLAVAVLGFTVAASARGESVKQAFGIDSNARCAVGLRLGSGASVVGEYFYGKDVYLEGRIGYEWTHGFNFTALHMWNPKDWNWTPNLGWWFIDAGAGAFVGAGAGHVNFGVAGSAKFGILFKEVPIRLAVDVTPKIGLVAYNGGISFWSTGIFNAGITATYCF